MADVLHVCAVQKGGPSSWPVQAQQPSSEIKSSLEPHHQITSIIPTLCMDTDKNTSTSISADDDDDENNNNNNSNLEGERDEARLERPESDKCTASRLSQAKRYNNSMYRNGHDD